MKMPMDIEAERAVLGSCLLEAAVIPEVDEILRVEDFSRAAHRRIWEAIREVHTRDGIPDSLLVSDALKSKGILQECGGTDYLYGLDDAVPSSVNADHYAKIVRHKSVARQSIVLAQELLRKSTEATNIEDALDIALDKATALRSGTATSEAKHIAEVLAEAASAGDREWFTTGISGIDDETGGIYPGGVTLLAGKAGSGKTTLAMQILTRAAKGQGNKIYVFSGDQPNRDIAVNVLCSELRLSDTEALRPHNVNRAMDVMTSGWDFFLDEGAFELGRMLAVTRRKIAQGYRFFLVDYLQLVAVPGKDKAEKAEEVANAFKALAKQFNIYTMLVSSVVKGDQKHRNDSPEMEDMRGGNDVAHAADQIWALKSSGVSTVNLHVLKNRRGKRGGYVPLELRGAHHYLRDPVGYTV